MLPIEQTGCSHECYVIAARIDKRDNMPAIDTARVLRHNKKGHKRVYTVHTHRTIYGLPYRYVWECGSSMGDAQ